MKGLSFVPAAVCAWLACGVASAQTAPPTTAPTGRDCTLKQVANLDMSTDVDGQVRVPVQVNGHDASLGIDTGSIYSSISIPLVNQLSLPHIDIPPGLFGYFGGVDVRYMTTIDNFSIGGAHGEKMQFLVEPSDVSDFDSDGLLGPDIMHLYDDEFDFAAGKFKMFRPDHCPGDVVYWTDAYATVPMTVSDDDWHIGISVTLDGKQFDAAVDSGSTRSVLAMETAKSLFGIDEKTPGIVSLGDLPINGQAVRAYKYPFAAMNFGGVTVNSPDILLIEQKQLGNNGPVALIGISILRQLHLYIAYNEHILYVSPAQEPAMQARPAPAAPAANTNAKP